MLNKKEKIMIFGALLLFALILGILIIPILELTFFKVVSVGFDYDDIYYSEENLEIYLFPSKAGVDKVIEKINLAEKEVHCALRALNHEELEEALFNKEKKGVKVRLVVNSDYLGNKNLHRSFVQFVDLNKDGMMHNNYCIIDNNIVITGSLIFNQNTIEKNLHDVLIINSVKLAEKYNSNFWKLYNKETLKRVEQEQEFIKINDNTQIKVLFCPIYNCENEFVTQVNNAKNEVYFATYSFTNSNIINALKEKKDINFGGILDQSGLTKDSIYFKNFNNIKLSKLTQIIHTKLLVFDDEISITGSTNPTYFGTQINNENMLIVKSEKINSFYKNLLKYLLEVSK